MTMSAAPSKIIHSRNGMHKKISKTPAAMSRYPPIRPPPALPTVQLFSHASCSTQRMRSPPPLPFLCAQAWPDEHFYLPAKAKTGSRFFRPPVFILCAYASPLSQHTSVPSGLSNPSDSYIFTSHGAEPTQSVATPRSRMRSKTACTSLRASPVRRRCGTM